MTDAKARIAEFDYVVRIRQVMQMTGLGKSTIYKLRSEGAFPAPVQLSSRAVGWRTSEIERWIMEQERRR